MKDTDKQRLERVKQAALAFQRHDWEQGTVAQAFYEAGDEETAMRMAVMAACRQTADGRCSQLGITPAVTDPCSIGEVLIHASERTGDAFLASAVEALLRWALRDAPRSRDGIVYHLTGGRQFWVDSIYMLPPFLARAGYHDEAVAQIDGYWRALYDAKSGLLFHKWDDETGQFARKAAWGVGNGWALAGLARVADLLPKARADDRARLLERLRCLLDAVLRHQRPDGRFTDVLDDPESFAEVNCGQMTAYVIYRGVDRGWLDARYIDRAERARAAAVASVDHYGLVRNTCGLPHFDHPGVAPEAQAFHIMMEAARDRCRDSGRL